MTEPRMRAGDSDRQDAVDRLTVHFTDGRLDAREYDDRVRRAYAAMYQDEFPALFVDLPGPAAGRSGHPQFGRDPGFGAAPDARGWSSPSGWSGPSGWSSPSGWSGLGGRLRHRPVRLLAVLAVIAVVASIGAVAHGFFPIPLIWLGMVLLFVRARGRIGCGRRWGGPGSSHGGPAR